MMRHDKIIISTKLHRYAKLLHISMLSNFKPTKAFCCPTHIDTFWRDTIWKKKKKSDVSIQRLFTSIQSFLCTPMAAIETKIQIAKKKKKKETHTFGNNTNIIGYTIILQMFKLHAEQQKGKKKKKKCNTTNEPNNAIIKSQMYHLIKR